MRFFACLFFILFSHATSAEYRVFRLVISPRIPASTATETPQPIPADTSGREIISTLDPDQYPNYYQVHDNEVVSYTETWMCKGRTGNFREPCSNPKATPAPADATTPAPATSSDTP